MKKPTKGSWIVRIRATVEKDLICSNCTQEEARQWPYVHFDSEKNVQQYDHEVLSVTPND